MRAKVLRNPNPMDFQSPLQMVSNFCIAISGCAYWRLSEIQAESRFALHKWQGWLTHKNDYSFLINRNSCIALHPASALAIVH